MGPLQDEKHILEILHLNAERYPQIPEELQKCHMVGLVRLSGQLGAHLSQFGIHNALDFVFDKDCQQFGLAHFAYPAHVSVRHFLHNGA